MGGVGYALDHIPRPLDVEEVFRRAEDERRLRGAHEDVIGVVDAFNQSRIISSNAFNLSAVTIVAILFVLITIPQARFVDRLIERDNKRIRAGG